MILDHQFQLSDNQRVCDAGATEASTNYYDFGVTNPYVNKGNAVRLHFNVTEAFAGTATTLTVTIQESSDNAVADAYADVVGCTTGAIAKAALVAGYEFDMYLPASCERYIQVLYTGDNTFETTGKIDCNLVIDTQSNRTW